MAKLPFVVAPKSITKLVRLGNEEIGVVEIEQRGFLSVGEKSFVDTIIQGSDGMTGIVKLAQKIGREKKLEVETVFNGIVQSFTGENNLLGEDILRQYGEQISELGAQMLESVQRKALACTTVLIQYRINSEWTIEDTMELHPDLLQEFVELYDKEDRRESPEAEVETDASDIVGKSQEESGDK